MSSAEHAHRSYLFAPGSNPAVMRKAIAAGADAVVLDLEDAVAPDEKELARTELRRLLDELEPRGERAGPPAIHVRVDRASSGFEPLDLEVAVHPAVEAIRLPKVEASEEVIAASIAMRDLESSRGLPIGSIAIYPTIESARGVLRAESIASSDPRVATLVLGHADLVADLAARGDDALTSLVPAAMVALAARSAGVAAPVDGATTTIDDAAALSAVAERARALGYAGKSAIHPRQLATIHAVFMPTDDEFEAAKRILRAAAAAAHGAIDLDGELVDAAILRRARGVLALRRDR